MKKLILICSILSMCSLEAKSYDKIKRRLDWHERKMEELYVDVQMLRERIEAMEEKIDGIHEYNASSTEEQAEGLATASNCDQP